MKSHTCTHILAVVLIWRFGNFRVNHQIKKSPNSCPVYMCTYKSPNISSAFCLFCPTPKFPVIRYLNFSRGLLEQRNYTTTGVRLLPRNTEDGTTRLETLAHQHSNVSRLTNSLTIQKSRTQYLPPGFSWGAGAPFRCGWTCPHGFHPLTQSPSPSTPPPAML